MGRFAVSVEDALVFLLGLGSALSVHLIGQIQLAEVLLIILMPALLLLRARTFWRPGLQVVFFLMAFWLIGQVMTDVYRSIPRLDWMRGDARIIFFAGDLLGVMLLMGRNHRSKVIFWVGYAISSLLAVKLQPTDNSIAYPWKFGYAEGTILLVVIASSFFYERRARSVVVGLLLGIAGLNLLMNFRSPVLFLLITLVLVVPLIPERVGRLRILPPEGTKARVLVTVVLVVIAGSTAANLVETVTAHGIAGEAAQVKTQDQSNSRYGLLLGGRPEILVSSRAVMDSPWLGHGSWAREWKYLEMLSDIEARMGYDVNFYYLESVQEPTIPAHSQLMSSWVSAGILGGIFWAYIFWLCIKATFRMAITLPPFAPLYIFLMVTIIWDILFSPFGNTRRIFDAVVLVMMMDTALAQAAPRAASVANRYGRGWKRTPPSQRVAALQGLEAGRGDSAPNFGA